MESFSEVILSVSDDEVEVLLGSGFAALSPPSGAASLVSPTRVVELSTSSAF